MVSNFYTDLRIGHKAEAVVLNTLAALTDDYTFIPVGNDRDYYHRGDIIAIDKNGKQTMIEVKNDSCIHYSGNVLCEEEVVFYESGEHQRGNFYSDYEIYCVADLVAHKLYFLDFKVLKKIYRVYGRQKDFYHEQQMSHTYLLSLDDVKRYNGILKVVKY